MIVGVVGAGGGVGTSTLSLLLSASVREFAGESADVVLVEADRSGGVVGARWQLGLDAGVGSWVSGLAADGSRSVSEFGRQVVKGFRVVPGPAGVVEAEKALTGQAVSLLSSAMSADTSRWWTVDLGRGCSTVRPLAQLSSVVVVVSSGAEEEVAGLAAVVEAVRPAKCVLVLGSRLSFSADEVVEFCGGEVVVRSGVECFDGSSAVKIIEGKGRKRSQEWKTAVKVREAVMELAASGQAAARSVS